MAPKRLEPIVISNKHLNPRLRQLIGHPFSGGTISFALSSLYGNGPLATLFSRKVQGRTREMYHERLNELDSFALGRYAIMSERLNRITSKVRLGVEAWSMYHARQPFTPLGAPLAGLSLTESTSIIHMMYRKITDELRESKMIVSPAFAEKYSIDVRNAELIGKTHPIFYVDYLGRLVLLPTTRMEYFRYLWQQKRAGKMGIHPWIWRGYLDKPKAPEPWKKWAKRKMEEWKERLLPEPIPGLAGARVPVPTRMRQRRTRYRK